jgi:hypothetical protein
MMLQTTYCEQHANGKPHELQQNSQKIQFSNTDNLFQSLFSINANNFT